MVEDELGCGIGAMAMPEDVFGRPGIIAEIWVWMGTLWMARWR